MFWYLKVNFHYHPFKVDLIGELDAFINLKRLQENLDIQSNRYNLLFENVPIQEALEIVNQCGTIEDVLILILMRIFILTC